MDKPNFKVRLEARVKNDALIGAREQLGLTLRAVAEEIGISENLYGTYERMQRYPRPEVQAKIIEFYREHGIKLDETIIFPEELKSFQPKKKYVVFKNIPLAELTYRDTQLLSYDGEISEVEDKIQEEQTHARFMNVISTLKEREAEVIKMRFGLDGHLPRTLEEVGAIYNLSRERIRRIEAKALRKLNHISRKRILRDFL